MKIHLIEKKHRNQCGRTPTRIQLNFHKTFLCIYSTTAQKDIFLEMTTLKQLH